MLAGGKYGGSRFFFVDKGFPGNLHHKMLRIREPVYSDQAVRRMFNKYSSLAAIELHITPHMFRHTFATSLLEADVDIRYI
jgi:integrase/recombinase XerD